MTIAIVAFLFALVVVLLLIRRGGDRSIVVAVSSILITTALNVDPLYQAIDEAIGGRNVADLVANGLLAVGVYFLLRAAAADQSSPTQLIVRRASAALLGMTLACMSLLFLRIDAPSTSTTFMLDFGAQPAAAGYSIAQYSYLLLAMCGLIIVGSAEGRSATGAQSVSAYAIVAGSGTGVALCLSVIVMDSAHVVGDFSTLQSFQPVYDILQPMTYVLIGLGFLGGPVDQWFWSRQRDREMRSTASNLRPIWELASTLRYGKTREVESSIVERSLRSMIVEIWNAVHDPAIALSLSGTYMRLLRRGEFLLEHRYRPSRASWREVQRNA